MASVGTASLLSKSDTSTSSVLPLGGAHPSNAQASLAAYHALTASHQQQQAKSCTQVAPQQVPATASPSEALAAYHAARTCASKSSVNALALPDHLASVNKPSTSARGGSLPAGSQLSSVPTSIDDIWSTIENLPMATVPSSKASNKNSLPAAFRLASSALDAMWHSLVMSDWGGSGNCTMLCILAAASSLGLWPFTEAARRLHSDFFVPTQADADSFREHCTGVFSSEPYQSTDVLTDIKASVANLSAQGELNDSRGSR